MVDILDRCLYLLMPIIKKFMCPDVKPCLLLIIGMLLYCCVIQGVQCCCTVVLDKVFNAVALLC